MFPVAAIVLGLLGSLHCVGMCGPIALALPLDRNSYGRISSGIFLYNSGRAITYAFLGALSGLAGCAVQWAAGQQTLSILAGSLVLLVLVAGLFGKKLESSKIFARPFLVVRSALGKLFSHPRPSAQFSIGMLNGLLPCGLVYAGLAGAAASGSALQGALFMFLFGMGTMPAMVALSFLGNKISVSFRQKLRKAVPVFVGIMALLLVLRGLGLGIPYLSPSNEKGKVECEYCKRHPHH
jgi:hypothetical protein